jgi:NAD(P)-dependent dehydrogenase (short-subunit alcohol dehydrogenase family)
MTAPPRRLEGRVALVSGAGGPTGQAIALNLAAQGARLLMTDISAGRLDATVKQLRAAAVEVAGSEDGVVAVRANAMDRGEAVALVEAGLARFGHIDILVNVVGGVRGASLYAFPPVGRGAVGRHDRADPEAGLPPHPVGGAGHARARQRQDRQRVVGRLCP